MRRIHNVPIFLLEAALAFRIQAIVNRWLAKRGIAV